MTLEHFFDFSNGKSIVGLSDGPYPIYGSTGLLGHSSTFLIEGPRTLIARVGANCGFCQYVDGKYWVSDNTLIATAKDNILPKYGFYLMQTLNLQRVKIGAAQPLLTIGILKSVDANVHSLSEQHHIVNTIGSIDNLIENINKQNEKLLHIGLTFINGLNDSLEHQKLLSICELIKGFEIGSQNYIETSADESLIRYLRVGDLLSLGNTFVEPSNELMICATDDILVAFDGAPGRNAIGLEGAYSSGIYKVKCNPKYKGLVYFEINSELNQKIIKDHSQGTTILHASKAIPFLETAKADDKNAEKLNALFKQITNNKKKLKLLNNEKQLLLSKYF